jgi:hypothetical protein
VVVVLVQIQETELVEMVGMELTFLQEQSQLVAQEQLARAVQVAVQAVVAALSEMAQTQLQQQVALVVLVVVAVQVVVLAMLAAQEYFTFSTEEQL